VRERGIGTEVKIKRERGMKVDRKWEEKRSRGKIGREVEEGRKRDRGTE